MKIEIDDLDNFTTKEIVKYLSYKTFLYEIINLWSDECDFEIEKELIQEALDNRFSQYEGV